MQFSYSVSSREISNLSLVFPYVDILNLGYLCNSQISSLPIQVIACSAKLQCEINCFTDFKITYDVQQGKKPKWTIMTSLSNLVHRIFIIMQTNLDNYVITHGRPLRLGEKSQGGIFETCSDLFPCFTRIISSLQIVDNNDVTVQVGPHGFSEACRPTWTMTPSPKVCRRGGGEG